MTEDPANRYPDLPAHDGLTRLQYVRHVLKVFARMWADLGGRRPHYSPTYYQENWLILRAARAICLEWCSEEVFEAICISRYDHWMRECDRRAGKRDDSWTARRAYARANFYGKVCYLTPY